MKVMLIEDHVMFRQLLSRGITEIDDLVVVNEASTVAEARELLRKNSFDVAVLNAGLPDGSGLDLMAEIKISKPDTKVVILTSLDDVDTFISAVEAGADGYVLKESEFEQLLQCLRSVFTGGCVYDSKLCAQAVRKLVAERADFGTINTQSSQIDVGSLSLRERQVAELLSKGYTNKEIARKLGISVSTTKTHVSKVFKNFGISSRRELLPKFVGLAELIGSSMHLRQKKTA